MSAFFHVWLSIALFGNGSGAISVRASFDISFRGFTAIDFKHPMLDDIYCQESLSKFVDSMVSYMTIFSNSCHSILGDRLSSPYRNHNRQVVHN
jgi:hypothetical protein